MRIITETDKNLKEPEIILRFPDGSEDASRLQQQAGRWNSLGGESSDLNRRFVNAQNRIARQDDSEIPFPGVDGREPDTSIDGEAGQYNRVHPNPIQEVFQWGPDERAAARLGYDEVS